MAENIASTGHPLLTYILNFKLTHKIHALLPHYLITVTFIMQRPYYLRSLALLLSLSLTLKRLYNYGTLAIALGLKSTNYSHSSGSYVTFFQTLLLSLYEDNGIKYREYRALFYKDYSMPYKVLL